MKVAPMHQDYLCFHCCPGGDVSLPLAEYRMTLHLFGASCASYALLKTADDNKDDSSVEAINTVKRNCYVDRFKSDASYDQAVTLFKKLKREINLTKWISNSRTVLVSILASDGTKKVKNLD